MIYELLEHEGLCLGGSTGINVAGAIRLAKQLGPGKTIVTILCDSGNRYQSKLFNPDFMRSKNLPVPEWLEKRSKIERAVREGVIALDDADFKMPGGRILPRSHARCGPRRLTLLGALSTAVTASRGAPPDVVTGPS